MTPQRIGFLFTMLAALVLTGCSEDSLHSNDGTLVARVLNAHQQERQVEVLMFSSRSPQNALASVEFPETRLSLTQVPVGLWEVTVNTLSTDGNTLRSVLIDDIYIQPDRETEVVVDLSELESAPVETPEEEPEPEPEPEEIEEDVPCSEDDDYLICQACIDGLVVTLDDDDACGGGCGRARGSRRAQCDRATRQLGAS